MNNQNLVGSLLAEMNEGNQMGNQMPPQYQGQMQMPPQYQGQMQMPPMGQMGQMGQMGPMPAPPIQAPGYRQMPPQEMPPQEPPSEEDPEEDLEESSQHPPDYTKYGMSDDQGLMDRLIGGLKEPIIVAILYMILSLPMVNTLLMRFIPQLGNNTIMYLALKTLIMVGLFTVIRYLVR